MSLLSRTPSMAPSHLWRPQPGHQGAHLTPWHCCSTRNACHHGLSKRGFPPQFTKGPPGAGMLQSCISPSGLPHHECHLLPHLPRLPHSKLLLPPLLSCWFSLGALLPESTHWSGRPQGSPALAPSPPLLTVSTLPFMASIRPAKNRKMAPCNDTHTDLCGHAGHTWAGAGASRRVGGAHLRVSLQVGLQELLCFLDVDIPGT